MKKEINTLTEEIESQKEKGLIEIVETELVRILHEEPERLLQKNPLNYIIRKIESPIWEITNIFSDAEKEYIRQLILELDVFNYYYENYREFIYQCPEYQQWLIEFPQLDDNDEKWYELENDTWFEDLEFQYFIIDEILIDELGEDALEDALMEVKINPKKYCGEISDELLAIRALNWKRACSEISCDDYNAQLEILEVALRNAEKKKEDLQKERRVKKVMRFINKLIEEN